MIDGAAVKIFLVMKLVLYKDKFKLASGLFLFIYLFFPSTLVFLVNKICGLL